jgi:transcription elongation factor Elf1
MPKIKCPLCGKPLVVKKTRKKKPYAVCDDCGLQMFVRYEEGIDRLKEKIKRQCDDNCLFCDECEELFGSGW